MQSTVLYQCIFCRFSFKSSLLSSRTLVSSKACSLLLFKALPLTTIVMPFLSLPVSSMKQTQHLNLHEVFVIFQVISSVISSVTFFFSLVRLSSFLHFLSYSKLSLYFWPAVATEQINWLVMRTV